MSLLAGDGEHQTAFVTTPLNADAESLFAAFGVRMAGAALDLFIALTIATAVLHFAIDAVGLSCIDSRLILLAVLLLYFSMFWSSPLRATPVQLLFGMRVVDETGERLSFGRAIARGVLLIGTIIAAISFIELPSIPYYGVVALLGYALLILAALTPNRQAGHDLVARSLVVNRIALKTPEHRGQLRQHVSGTVPILRKYRRPSALSIVANMLVLGIPLFVLLIFAQTRHVMDLRSRVGYAVGQATVLKAAVQEYYVDARQWPTKNSELGAAISVEFPDGGYYELEDDGVIRIRFTVKPELMKGSIVLSPAAGEDGVTWECRVDGGLAKEYMVAACRH